MPCLLSIQIISPTEGWAVGKEIYYWDGSEWSEIESPAPNYLYSVYMVSSTEGWAVGYGGVILRYGPAGETGKEGQGGGFPLMLLILPVLVVVLALGAFFVRRMLRPEVAWVGE
ncbi:MAG: hypothetical protein QMD00_05775 [Hadesarchaea archaeon]|nr:hypothetical protein [Hadesarchaea archaeon]